MLGSINEPQAFDKSLKTKNSIDSDLKEAKADRNSKMGSVDDLYSSDSDSESILIDYNKMS